MKIDSTLKKHILDGNVILFLGSGASLGSWKKTTSEKMPTTNELRDLLARKFLDESWVQYPLSEVAEIAISQTDIVTVQSYVRSIFLDFQPCPFHLDIPKYSWGGIYTTNYDLIIESAYANMPSRKQELVPIHRTSNRIDVLVKDPQQQLAYTKLHGCINKIDEHDLPLIFTPDQYVSHKNGRESLFNRIVDQAISKPILFVGHSLSDLDIREVLQKVSSSTESRPRCWALMYDFTEQHSSLWESKRITLIKGSFEEFMHSLDKQVSDVELNFKRRVTAHPLESKFHLKNDSLTEEALRVLINPMQYISNTMFLEEQLKPKLFYHGLSNGWGPIQAEMDVRRKLGDEIIADVILVEESERNSNIELFHISGSAGSGKTIILKRIAYDAAIDYDRVCLFWDSSERLDANAILEIAEKINERIFLFVDKAASHVNDVIFLINKFKRASQKISCFISERTNVWNTECGSLQRYLTDTFDVRKLSPREINDLLNKLDKYGCLGALAELERKEQFKEISEKLDRQLLVALHEATMAKSFQEIIQDEYDNIGERKAQLIYRTVCIMNQFGVPVRAGIIHRIHGVTFNEYKESLFEPLENVIHIRQEVHGDYSYEARHPTIAEMVFSHALTSNDERLNSYISLLQSLDVGYSSDRTAFRELIKHKHLSSVFQNPEDIEKIYKISISVCGDDDFYYQQFAIFYMRSKKQNFNLAERYLVLAKEFGQHNSSIDHTWAEMEFIRGTKSTGLERERLFNKSTRLAQEASLSSWDASFGHSTLCKIAIKRLEDALRVEDEELISDATNNAQQRLKYTLEKHPDAEAILELEARLARLLKDSDRAIRALERAFSLNNANSHLASALGGIYESNNEVQKALDVYKKVLLANNVDKVAHAKLGYIYSTDDSFSSAEIAEYHWRHSYTDGDPNIVNQVWYSRQLYLNNKFEEYITLVNKMRGIKLPPKTRNSIRGIVKTANKQDFLIGKVIKADTNYLLLETPGLKGTHFLHISNCPEDKWDKLEVGSDICYNLGFTASGAAAVVPEK